jgi:eukaryotic-like serine/threonine-protein kinase
VAVKLLRLDRDSKENRQRMLREAQLASTLTSPHSVEILDLGVAQNGFPYFVMNYVQGETIASLTRGNALEPKRAIHIWKQIVHAIREAHLRGLIHRDIKPQNIMVGRRGEIEDFATLLDFGLVKSLEVVLDDIQTRSVGWMGTMRYLPPERVGRPDFCNVRSDIYCLGIVLYRMLVGRDPYIALEGEDIVTIIMESPPYTPPVEVMSKIPPCLWTLTMGCMAKSPSDRPASCDELLDRLDELEG